MKVYSCKNPYNNRVLLFKCKCCNSIDDFKLYKIYEYNGIVEYKKCGNKMSYDGQCIHDMTCSMDYCLYIKELDNTFIATDEDISLKEIA